MILSRDFRRIRVGRRIVASEGRAWVISPAGTPYDCGDHHSKCAEDEFLYDLFKKGEKYEGDLEQDSSFVERWLWENGWAKIGYFERASLVHLAVRGMGYGMFKAFKKILLDWNLDDNCRIEVLSPGRAVFYWNDFKDFDSLDDMKWFAENM